MTYKVVLYTTAEGITAGVPTLPGCWSEGDTEAEALDNIRDAICEYLACEATPQDREELLNVEVREVEVGS